MIDLVAGALRNATKVVAFTHTNPDGDAIGSLAALDCLLESLGAERECWCLDPIPDIYESLPRVERFRTEALPEHLAGADLAVALDIAVENRINPDILAAVRAADLPLVNIDHHLTNTRFGRINWVRPKCAATAVMIHDLFLHLGLPVGVDAATAIYAGLMTDTGHFSFHRTEAETFDLAASLVRQGANPTLLKERIYFNQPHRKIKLLARVLDRLQVDSEARLGWIWASAQDSEELGVTTPDFEGIPDLVNIARGVDLLLLFREIPGQPVKINIRSKGDVDSSALGELFGGGGHLNAAGASYGGTLEEALEEVVAKAKEYMATVAAGAAAG